MTNEAEDVEARRKWKFATTVAWTGYIVSVLLIVLVIGMTLIMMLNGQAIPEALNTAFNVCLGYIALLLSQARDMLKGAND